MDAEPVRRKKLSGLFREGKPDGFFFYVFDGSESCRTRTYK